MSVVTRPPNIFDVLLSLKTVVPVDLDHINRKQMLNIEDRFSNGYILDKIMGTRPPYFKTANIRILSANSKYRSQL